MDKVQKLKHHIEELKGQLRRLLEEGKNADEVMALNQEIDRLIVQYYRLTSH